MPTFIDTAAKNDPECGQAFMEAGNTCPELDFFDVVTPTGLSWRRNYITQGPVSTSGRGINEGVDPSGSSREREDVNCGTQTTYSVIDPADLKSVGNLEDQAQYLQTEKESGAVEFKRSLANSVMYGDDSWDGLQAKAEHVLHALEEDTGSAYTSVMLLWSGKTGVAAKNGVKVVLGGGGNIEYSDFNTQDILEDGKMRPAHVAHIEAYPCVSRGDKCSIVRYANICTEDGAGFDDNKAAEMLDLLPESVSSDTGNLRFVMNQRTRSQVRASRVATSETGVASYPTECHGIEIISTATLTNSEEFVTA